MSDEHKPDDRLDRATAALRDTPVPEMPGDLVERILAATQPEKRPATQRKIPMKTILRLAAALLLCASVLAFLMVTGTPRVAFADALTALKEIKTVQARVTTRIKFPDVGEKTFEGEIIVVAPNKMRSTTAAVEEDANGQRITHGTNIQIHDWASGQALALWPDVKMARLSTTTDVPESERPINLIQTLMNTDARNAKAIGEKEIAGKKVQGFEVPEGKTTMTIWIDPATRLPVEVETVMASTPMLVGSGATNYTEFVWNQEVDPSLVSLDVPAGYSLQKDKPVSFRVTEQDVLNGLKQASDFLGGRYPDKFDVTGMSYDIGFRVGMATGQPDEAQLREQSIQVQRAAGRAWGFIMDPANGSDFQYAGKGKRAGTKDPILWYRPAGSQNYRVIDASLGVTEVPAEQLPKAKSQSLSEPKKQPAAPAAK